MKKWKVVSGEGLDPEEALGKNIATQQNWVGQLGGRNFNVEPLGTTCDSAGERVLTVICSWEEPEDEDPEDEDPNDEKEPTGPAKRHLKPVA